MTGETRQKDIEREHRTTGAEEQFLVEVEKRESQAPSFDGLALRRIGLSQEEAMVVQVFFMKARSVGFSPARFVQSECVRALISSLRFLPRTDKTGRITPESCGSGDRFRQEYSRAAMWSNREELRPLLLVVLGKVFAWLEEFQKRNNLVEATRPGQETVMAGAGLEDEPKATGKQKKLLARLTRAAGIAFDDSEVDGLSRREASARITELFRGAARAVPGVGL